MKISNFNEVFLKHALPVDSMGRPQKHELTSGLCYYWAHVFAKVIGGTCITVGSKNEIGDLSGHMQILYKGKYYDAKNLNGSKTPLNKRTNDNLWCHPSPAAAQNFWKTPKTELKIHQKVIRKILTQN